MGFQRRCEARRPSRTSQLWRRKGREKAPPKPINPKMKTDMDTPETPLPMPAVPGSARTAKDHAILMAYDAFGLCLGSPPRHFPAGEVLRWMQCVMTEQLKQNGYHKCSGCDTLISAGAPALCPQCQDSATGPNMEDTTKDLRALSASDLFGLADELAFRRQFVTQFLASYCAANFNDFCARGLQDKLETSPVEDADYLSFAAWKHWCETMKPNGAGEETASK
jgi:hypothetical protein